MIGNAYPYLNTGYSILEEGDLNPVTLGLDVKCCWVVDRQAQMLEKFASKQEAERYLDAFFAQQRQIDQQ